MTPRFDIYIKAASDGKSTGDCPFSQFVSMVAHIKIPTDQYTLIPIDISNKPQSFLDINPKGTVPVLVNKDTNDVIADSQLIVREICEAFPDVDLKVDYDGPAIQACSGVFPKLALLLKNTDTEAIPALRRALEDELAKVDAFLQSKECGGGVFLTGKNMCTLDCSLLPKLHHVQVAGRYYQKFEIPTSLKALQKYIKAGEASSAFQHTKYDDEEIIKGWDRHGIIKVE